MKTAILIFAAELKYQWELFTMAVVAIVVSSTVSAFFTKEWLWMMLGFGTLAYIIGAISIGSRMDSEKRERTGRMLPLPPVAYGFIRFLVFVAYHLAITATIMIGIFIGGVAWLPLSDLFTLFGFNLIITVIFFLNDDLYYMGGWFLRIMLWTTILVIGLTSLVVTGEFGFSISPDRPKSVIDATIFNATWIILMGLDVWIYTRRKSYYK